METTDTELRDLLQTLLKKQNKQAIKNKKIMSKVQKLRSKLKEKDSENVRNHIFQLYKYTHGEICQ